MLIQKPIGYGEKNAMPSPTHVTASAITTDRARPSAGRAVSRAAVAAGATSRANTSRLPVTWLAPAAATARRTRKPAATRRTGIPRARATAGSTELNSRGRARNVRTARQKTPAISRVVTWSSETPMMVPNSRLFKPDRKPLYRLTNRNPHAKAKACTVPMTADSSP